MIARIKYAAAKIPGVFLAYGVIPRADPAGSGEREARSDDGYSNVA